VSASAGRNVESIQPLSPAQQGMLLASLEGRERGVHVEQLVCGVRGELDPDAFRGAWDALVERHESLRSAFVWKDQPRPLRVVMRRVELPLETADWRSAPPPEREARLAEAVAAQGAAGFELARAPLFRLALYRTGADEQHLVWTCHHLVMDGWCIPLVLDELAALYAERSGGPPADLSPARPYRDYVAWLAGREPAQSERFWRETLAGVEAPTPLGRPAETPREPAGYGSSTLSLGARVSERLEAVCRERRVTLATLVQGVWALLLGRYAARADVVFGVTTSGRPPGLAGIERTVGLFINTLPLRLHVPREGPLWPWLATVQERAAAVREHEFVSLGDVHRWSGVPGGDALFESLLVYENYPRRPRDADAGPIVFEPRPDVSAGARTQYACTLVVESDEALSVHAVYDESRLAGEEVAKVLEHWRRVVERIATAPGAAVADLLELVPDDEIPRVAPRPAEAAAVEAPATELETEIAAVWTELLGRPVGRTADVFSLGGHSLLATQALSRLDEVFGVRLPLRTMFEARTVAELARAVERARAAGAPAQPAPPLERVGRDGDAPLSFAQQRLWFVDRLLGGSAAYNVYDAYLLEGPLDEEALDRVLLRLLGRHEALRTVFRERHGEPRQRVLPAPERLLRREELPGAPVEEALERARAEAERPFDLERELPVRALLSVLGPERRLLLLTIHHIACDGWSIERIERELEELYRAERTGVPTTLPEPELQYSDFAQWQRRTLTGERLERELAYWRSALGPEPPALELPTDRPRPPEQRFRGARARRRLGAELTAALRELGEREEATLFMTLLAGYAALLARLSGQERLQVATPVAGRTRRELEPLVGFFVNTLVLPLRLDLQAPFRTALRAARQRALETFGHQELPYERLVEELSPPRDPSRNALFQTMLALEYARPPLDLDGLHVRELDLDNRTSKFDLTLFVSEDADELEALLEYNTDLFDSGTADRLLARLETLLGAATSHPETPLAELPLLPSEERRLVLRRSRGEARPREPRTLGARFSERAAATPERTAVRHGDTRVGYAELEARSNRLAHELLRRGIAAEQLVGVQLERSPELVVALLGILKAGAAYLPLDPTHPPARLAAMLAEADAPLLLSEERLAATLPTGAHTTLLLDREAETIARHPSEPPPERVAPDGLAYAIYTSGSTGEPKGILGHHRGVVNYLDHVHELLDLRPDDVVLQLAFPTFDGSVRDTFGPLLAGASVVVPEAHEAKDATALVSLLERRRATAILSVVPSFLRVLLAAAEGAGTDTSSLRLLLVGGEALQPGDVEHARAVLGPQVLVVNHYGPSECTMTTTFQPIERADEPILVGRPIPNTSCYVVDDRREPAPVGVPGEVLIGGAGVTRGYLGKPGLTADRYEPDPFGVSGRVYRTGDLGRWTADGGLEFLGRLDGQLKVRGIRVEPGEVEAALRLEPAVRDAAVQGLTDASGGTELLAYVEAPGDAPSADALRAALQKRLPEALIPSRFVVLSSFPRTGNGKIDRRRLPAPESERPALQTEFVGPRDVLELEMVGLWETLLGVRPVGVLDDFFAVGGHSLKAVELIDAIRRRFGRDVPLSALFRTPTVEHLCSLLRGAIEAPGGCLVPMQAGDGSRPPLFLVHPQSGEICSYFHLVRALPEEETVYGLQSVGYDTDEEPLTDVESMARRYVDELRDVAPEGPYRLAGWSFGGNVAFEMAVQLEQAGEEVEFIGILDARVFGRDEIDDWYREKSGIVKYGLVAGVEADALEELDEDAALRFLLRHEQETHQVARDEHTGAVRRMVSVFATNSLAAEKYWTSATVAADVYLFRATQKHPTLPNPIVDPEGWRERTRSRLHVFDVEANHHNLVAPGQAPELARRLVEAMRHAGRAARAAERVPA
jgi:amino acid adenylation domain-containing protein